MILDVHNHIGVDKGGARQNIRQLKKNMATYGINKCVIFPFDEPTDLVEASVNLLKYKSPSIIPFLRFDPKRVDDKEVEMLLAEYDFKGIKLHTRAENSTR